MNTIEAAAEYFRLEPQQITGLRRVSYIARARFVTAWVLRRRFKLSLPQVGRMLARDHSTIHHALQQAEILFATNPDYARAATVLVAMPGMTIPPEIYVSKADLRAAENALKRARNHRRKLRLRERAQAERANRAVGKNASPLAKQTAGSRQLAAAMLALAA